MDWARKFAKTFLPAWWRDRIDLEGSSIREFMRYASQNEADGARIIDTGAGQCPYRSYFTARNYIAVDFAKGETTWDYSKLDAVCRLEKLPFADGRFDAAISTQVLEHVPEPLEVLKESLRILKPGGRLYMTAPLGFGEHQQPYDYFRYTRYGLRYLLEKAGYENVQIQPRGGYFRYLAVMSMWIYMYLFPARRSRIWKIALSPLQLAAVIIFIFLMPPFFSFFDFLDTEKAITLGFRVEARRPELEK